MLIKISNWLLKISTTWLMIASLLAMVLFMIFILPAQAAGSSSETGTERSPDTSFFYTPDDLYQMAQEYGPNGRQAYIQARWSFDLVFPLVYTAFLALGISWFFQRLEGWGNFWKLTNLIPVLGGFFDLLENTATSLVMGRYPAETWLIASAASLFTPVKWILVSAGFFPYFLLGFSWLFQQLPKRKT